jgi:murein DD-endopeptidase MepM/ murein hydrolase activator NlpD
MKSTQGSQTQASNQASRWDFTPIKRWAWLVGVGIVSCVGLGNTPQSWAQSAADLELPPAAEPAPAAPPPPAPVEAAPRPAPRSVTPQPSAQSAPKPAAVPSPQAAAPLDIPDTPAVERPTEAPSAAPAVEQPAPSAAAETPESIRIDIETGSTSSNAPAPTTVVPSSIPTAESTPNNYGTVFIDPTDYRVGATDEGPNVVISERSSGCQFTLNQGQAVSGNSCAHPTTGRTNPVASANGGGVPGVPQAQGQQRRPASGGREVNIGPVRINASGVQISGRTTYAGREYYNRLARPLINLQAGEQFLFPLSIPAPITSLFGWRTHPIFGDQRFHSGTDVGAPMGTPVLATRAGQVTLSDFLGGYGLTVILNHEDGTLESRYAHLSQLFVQVGERVEQGDVIGLVGSTGNSTGPHLHFEIRQLTSDGWVAVSPNEILQGALANLIEVINNPMLALNASAQSGVDPTKALTTPPAYGLASGKGEAEKSLYGDPNLAFRPAQPNAN